MSGADAVRQCVLSAGDEINARPWTERTVGIVLVRLSS